MIILEPKVADFYPRIHLYLMIIRWKRIYEKKIMYSAKGEIFCPFDRYIHNGADIENCNVAEMQLSFISSQLSSPIHQYKSLIWNDYPTI